MKNLKKSTFFAVVGAFTALAAFIILFAIPSSAAACTITTSCVPTYNGYPFPVPQYPSLNYVYFQNPAQNYINGLNYTPVVYPIPVYVQTGVTSNGNIAYSTPYGNQTYPSLDYVQNGQATTGTTIHGTYGYPVNSYNNPQPYSYNGYGTNGYNNGFTMTSGNGNYGNGYNNGYNGGGFVQTSGY